ncbi:MAG: tRNA lysidine(34) synthetase TilS [Bacillota bacterium]
MLEKFIKTLEDFKMVSEGEGIVIGVSGGPDSITLLHLFHRVQERYRLRLYAVHLNHQFRGTDADEDAAYVKSFCDKLGIEAFIYSENVTEYSKHRGITFEEAGREIRYRLFDEILDQKRAGKIAVAQNMDDQAETVLMRLMRGSGAEGLSAIDHIRDNKIIRPLLDISRKEIEAYCSLHELKPRIDKTNSEVIYTRNRIRLELIPYIESHFNPNIKETLCRTAKLLREDNNFIAEQVDKAFGKLVRKENDRITVLLRSLKELHPAVAKRVVREMLKQYLGDIKNIQSIHVENIMGLVDKQTVGASIDLPGYITAAIDYEYLMIKKKENEIQKHDFTYDLKIGSVSEFSLLNLIIISKIIDKEHIGEIPKSDTIKYFDLDKIHQGIKLRNRRNGDRFSPLGMKGSKKLKEFFIDEKIPRTLRDEIPLICDGDEIVWVIGYRMSEKYKVTSDTEHILMIEYKNK